MLVVVRVDVDKYPLVPLTYNATVLTLQVTRSTGSWSENAIFGVLESATKKNNDASIMEEPSSSD